MNLDGRVQRISIARSRYKATVEFVSSGTGAQGFQPRLDSIALHRRLFPSSEEAWDAVLERLVLVRPGALLFTSFEFGEQVRHGVELLRGRTGSVVERQRLEIRAMRVARGACRVRTPGGTTYQDFQIFRMLRQYRGEAPSRDICQQRLGGPFDPLRFPSLGAAAEYVLGAVSLTLRTPADTTTAWLRPAEAIGLRCDGASLPDVTAFDAECWPTSDVDRGIGPTGRLGRAWPTAWPEHAP